MKSVNDVNILDIFKARRAENVTLGGVYFVIVLALTIIFILLDGGRCWGDEPKTLVASYYSVRSLKRDGQWSKTHGRTASGDLFSDEKLTAASWDYPLGTKVKISRTDNKTSVVVLVNDRTARRFEGKRIDISKAAMFALGGKPALKKGLLKVIVEQI